VIPDLWTASPAQVWSCALRLLRSADMNVRLLTQRPLRALMLRFMAELFSDYRSFLFFVNGRKVRRRACDPRNQRAGA
jgi:hypothetical protein